MGQNMSIAIEVDNVSKEYRIGVISHGMLYKDMQSWIARRMGLPDPHTSIDKSGNVTSKERFWALKDISLRIEAGDRVGIVGRNGAGKSTLLKILSRITSPTKGTIRIRGRIASLLEVGTGFNPELTGRENIYLNGAILGMKAREITNKMDEIIAFSEIEKFIDTPVKRYSSGMYVRLAFAVAAHLDGEILLADEVLAVGDIDFQRKCLGKMEDVSKNEGRTVVFVSHNIPAIENLCNTGYYLESGVVKYSGDIAKVVNLYYGTPIFDKSKFDLANVHRTGNRRVLFSKVNLVDNDGNAITDTIQGQPFRVRFSVVAAVPGPLYLDCGLSVHPLSNEIIFVDYSSYHGIPIEMDGHEKMIEFTLSNLDLSPGSYYIRVRLLENGQEADWIQDPVHYFDVIRGDFYGTESAGFEGKSVFAVKGAWRTI